MINGYNASDILLIALMPGDPISSTITKIQRQLSQKQLVTTSHALPPIIPISYVVAADLQLFLDLVSSHSWRPLLTGSCHTVENFLFADVYPSDIWHQLKLQIKENTNLNTPGPIPLVNSLLVSIDANYKLKDLKSHNLQKNKLLTNLGSRKWTAIAAKTFHKTFCNAESWIWEIVCSRRIRYQTKSEAEKNKRSLFKNNHVF